MPEENTKSREAARNLSQQIMKAGCVLMAIYEEENKTMTVYAAKKPVIDPQVGAASVVQSFSLFGAP